MPVTIQIREEGRILCIKTSDPYTVDDFKPVFVQELDHRNAFQQQHPGEPVHMLIDMTDAKNAANNFLRARNTPGLSHPTSGYVALVGANRFIRALSETVFRLTHFKRVYFAETEAEGMAYLQKIIHETAPAIVYTPQ